MATSEILKTSKILKNMLRKEKSQNQLKILKSLERKLLQLK